MSEALTILKWWVVLSVCAALLFVAVSLGAVVVGLTQRMFDDAGVHW